MRKRLVVLQAVLGAALVLGAAAPGLAQTKFTIAHVLSTSSHYSAGAKAMMAALEELSGGSIELREAHGGSLGGERELIEATQMGTLDLVITSTGPVGNFVPATEIFDIPFLFTSFEHAHAVLDGPIGQAVLEKFPEHGLRALAWAENGFRNLTNSVRPIRTPADAKGLKIRTMENPIHIEAFKTLGILPTPMDFTELFTALEQGTVDGQENPLSVILHAHFAEVQEYLSLTRHIYSPAVILIAPSVWNGLSDQEQGWFAEAAQAAVKAIRAKVAREAVAGIDALRDQGMQVVLHEDIDIDAFQTQLRPAYEHFAAQFGQDRIEEIRNYAF